MPSALEIILKKIEDKNPAHYKKMRANISVFDSEYTNSANAFLNKYISYLEKNKIGLDFGIDCYLHMISDMIEERYKFISTGKYSNTSFEEVEKAVYGNEERMTYRMHGLILAQYLWFEQYERILLFTDNLKKYIHSNEKYLEIGGGHGLYINEAVRLIPEMGRFELVDISESSLNLATGIINDNRIKYYLNNIFDFINEENYDSITLGEVLEHMEQPLHLLKKISVMLGNNGVCYLTMPVNAPIIDHIYLFNTVEEIKELFHAAGLKIIEEKVVASKKLSPQKAEKFKVPIMYAAVLKNNN